MDNAAAVQVGLALLLGLLVIASALLATGIVAVAVMRVVRLARLVESAAASLETEAEAVRTRIAGTTEALRAASERIVDVERRLMQQEHE